ncbi:hypothetical protein [Robiginitalea sp. SC105]|uniref:hypothetical protein n=1 Tax=Robiginitalea sp. SC105 TaxID=2762332 RepID=UPI00163A4ADD|nr:hypothetical protein [Robiginitalea sp. SC105]MBC2839493.1 hypothetical protein [Robiginitalea sp. SC105]
MKKAIFYASALIAALLLIHIISIVSTDLDRLTEYGYGFLAGKVILLVLFLAIAWFTRNKILSKK